MNLVEFLRSKIKEIQKEYEEIINGTKINNINNKINKLEALVNKINTNPERLTREEILYIYNNMEHSIDDPEGFISIVLNQEELNPADDEYDYKRKKRIDIIDRLTETINKIIIKYEQDKEKIEEAKKHSPAIVIKNINLLIEKLMDKDDIRKISVQEFNLLESLTKDENYFTNFRIFVQILKYNYKPEREKLEYNKVDIDELKNILIREFNLNKELLILIDKYKKDVKERASVENYRAILNYLKEENVLWEFNNETLFRILNNSSLELVKEVLEKAKKDDIFNTIFKAPASVWEKEVDLGTSKSVRKTISRGSSNSSSNKESRLPIGGISYEQFLKNRNFLLERGFNVNEENFYKGYEAVLDINPKRLESNYKKLVLYGIIKDTLPQTFTNVSALSSSFIMQSIDKYIEAGLYDYIRRHTTMVNKNKDEGLFARLYAIRKEALRRTELRFPQNSEEHTRIFEEEFKNMAMYKKDPTCLSGEVTDTRVLRDPVILQKLLDDNGVYKPIVNKYDEINKILEEVNSHNIDYSHIFDINITELDRFYKVGEYKYLFGNQIISRYKVLRNYSILKKMNKYDEKDILMMSIIFDTILDKKTFEEIAKAIGYNYIEENKRDDDGISKRI